MRVVLESTTALRFFLFCEIGEPCYSLFCSSLSAAEKSVSATKRNSSAKIKHDCVQCRHRGIINESPNVGCRSLPSSSPIASLMIQLHSTPLFTTKKLDQVTCRRRKRGFSFRVACCTLETVERQEMVYSRLLC